MSPTRRRRSTGRSAQGLNGSNGVVVGGVAVVRPRVSVGTKAMVKVVEFWLSTSPLPSFRGRKVPALLVGVKTHMRMKRYILKQKHGYPANIYQPIVPSHENGTI